MFAPEKARVLHLLGELVLRLNGAVDIWTTACLSHFMPDLHGFLDKQCDVLRSIVTVIRTLLRIEGEHQSESECLEKLASGCERLRGVFHVLEGHASEDVAQVRQAAEELKSIYEELLDAIQNLSRAIGMPLAEEPEEQRQFHQRILHELPELFQNAAN